MAALGKPGAAFFTDQIFDMFQKQLATPRPVLITGEEEIFEGDALFQVRCGNHWQNVGHLGHLGFIGGKPGTMKSTILRYIAASGAAPSPLGFKLNLDGKRVVWYDGEQPQDIVVKSVREIIRLTDNRVDLDSFFEMNSLTHEMDPVERRRALWYDLKTRVMPRMDTAVIVIDGLANFLSNINDFVEAMDVLNKFMLIAKKMNAMIIVLAHLAERESGMKLFGAAGTETEKLASWGFHMELRGKYFVMTDRKGRYGFVAPKAFQFGAKKGILTEEPYYPW